MQTKNTLFVVGAGASREFGLPIGRDLVTKIADKLRFFSGGGDDYIRDVLTRSEPGRIQENVSAARIVSDGVVHASSIDRFLHIHRSSKEMVRAGKLAIARCIIEAEARSTLRAKAGHSPNFQEGTTDSEPLRAIDSWLGRLLLMQQEGTNANNPEDVFKGLSFLTFNYDRCIQHYLYYAVQKLYNWDNTLAAKTVNAIPIVHAYGTVGALGWGGGAPEEVVEFGNAESLVGESLDAAAQRILTFTQTQEAARETEIRLMMEGADQIVFLGCGFNEQNLELISCVNKTKAKRVFATTYGMSKADQSVVQYDLVECLSQKHASKHLRFSHAALILRPQPAGRFLGDFGRALSSDRAFELAPNKLFGASE